MSKPTVVFFGSFLEYSAQVLQSLHESDVVEVIGVVTTPPKPAGRKKELKPTHVHEYAQTNNLPVFTPERLTDSPTNRLTTKPDLFVVAGYGKLLPTSWLAFPSIAPINIHFSLLPKYRGAMPGEWAIFMGEEVTGVSLIEMSPQLDAGNIIARAKYQIKPDDNRETLYKNLYDLGAELFLSTVERYLSYKLQATSNKLQASDSSTIEQFNKLATNRTLNLSTRQPIHPSNHLHISDLDGNRLTDQLINRLTNIYLPPIPQTKSISPYARLIGKDETKVDWRLVEAAIQGKSPDEQFFSPLLEELPAKSLTTQGWAQSLERMIRAFYGWPGVWTEVSTDKGVKRLKIHTAKLDKGKLELDLVQLEGKQPVPASQIKPLNFLDV